MSQIITSLFRILHSAESRRVEHPVPWKARSLLCSALHTYPTPSLALSSPAPLALFSAPWTLPRISLRQMLFPQIDISHQWGLPSPVGQVAPSTFFPAQFFSFSLPNMLYFPIDGISLLSSIKCKPHEGKGTLLHCVSKVWNSAWPGYEVIKYLLNE